MEDQPKAEGEADKKIVHVYPLVKVAAKTIKELMDKKFGTFWHVVVGEGFGYEVSYETKNLLYLFFGGNLAIVLWKCS
uniref:Uncharacterized protein n=1 Tax=Anopheles albimanus TaxID=7167 RepID=A0A182FGR8_ANOAL